MPEKPLVSVVTPVYNGEDFLAECIESVLQQTYERFEYIIVDNCSKDRTFEIALDYAKKDGRVRVHRNSEFVGVIENHNIAFRLIAADSKYCKVVCADDWLFPECIARMVSVAEANPSVGIVGSYQLSGGGSNPRHWRVRWDQIPYPSTVIPGREICRSHLLGGPYVFGDPTSTLFRADLVRAQKDFFPNSSPHADTSACFKYLCDTDFGFVHQVLSYERVHGDRQSAAAEIYNAYAPAFINDLLAYGSYYLTEAETKKRLAEIMGYYYKFLAVGVINMRGRDFWRYHREKLNSLGYPLNHFRLMWAVLLKLIDLLLNPKRAIEALFRRATEHRT